jgi:ferric-dicitrate binding protein FerR (iron transport regulator)
MTEHPKTDVLAELIRSVGRRAQPPREDYERILQVSQQAWQRAVRQRTRRRWTLALAAGVALLGVSLAILNFIDSTPGGAVVARLTISRGAVFASDEVGKAGRLLTGGGVEILDGTRLRTDASGAAALRLDSGVSLRLAASTDLLLRPGNRIELLSGRVYLDTDGQRGGSVELATRFGLLRDIGTQFEVLATADRLRVRTREGAVRLTRGSESEDLECAGSEELRVDSHGHVERGHIAAHDPEWAWAALLSEPPRGAQLPLVRFLEWVARETGRHVRYDSPETEARVRRVVLHVNSINLAPVEALEAALASTDIEYTLPDEATILLQPRRGG